MIYCDACKTMTPNDQLDRITEDYGEQFDVCPHCGDPALYDAEVCPICGEYMPPQGMRGYHWAACDECADNWMNEIAAALAPLVTSIGNDTGEPTNTYYMGDMLCMETDTIINKIEILIMEREQK